MVGTVVPIAEAIRDIASGLQFLGERRFIAKHDLQSIGGAERVSD